MTVKEAIERLKLCSENQCNICGRYEKEECMLERNRCETILLNLIQKQDTEINKLKEENERLKYSCAKATEIIEEYANETENDIKKLIEYQEKYLDN